MKFEKKIEAAKAMADSDLKLSTLTTLALQAMPHSSTQKDIHTEINRLRKAGYQIPIPEKYKPKTSASGEKFEVHIAGSKAAPVIYDNKAQAEKTKRNAELLGFEMTIKKVEPKQETNKMAEKKKNDKTPKKATLSKASEAKQTTKRIKFKKAMADKRGNINMVEAEGIPYTSKNGLDVVLHKEHDGWYATEISTGKLCTTEGKTTMSAAKAEVEQNSSTVKRLLNKLKQHPKEKVKPSEPNAKPIQPKKVVQKPSAKRAEPKPAAPKKEPTGAKKPASVKKSAADKLLMHNDKDEMKADSKKPLVINVGNAKPVSKVLRKVAKSGGYTAWDDVKRNGKTFATEQEAKDYAADVFKKTGKIVPISPTDRQVTHTFKPEEEKKKK